MILEEGMYFSDYLKLFKNENSIKGDLARDFIESKSKAKNYKAVLQNMQKNHACDVAFEALDEIHQMYLMEVNV